MTPHEYRIASEELNAQADEIGALVEALRSREQRVARGSRAIQEPADATLGGPLRDVVAQPRRELEARTGGPRGRAGAPEGGAPVNLSRDRIRAAAADAEARRGCTHPGDPIVHRDGRVTCPCGELLGRIPRERTEGWGQGELTEGYGK